MPIPDARGQQLFAPPGPDLGTALSPETEEAAGRRHPRLRSVLYVGFFMGFSVVAVLVFALLALLAMGVVGA